MPPSPQPFYVSVSDALTDRHFGTVSCIPGPTFRVPMHVEWRLDGQIVRGDVIGLDASGFCANRVPPHANCEMTVRDDQEFVQTVSARVGVIDVPVVEGYECEPASSAVARDGVVSARVCRAPAQCKYLWSNGAVTTTPKLALATPGIYVVTLLAPERTALLQLHAAAPGVVDVRPSPS